MFRHRSQLDDPMLRSTCDARHRSHRTANPHRELSFLDSKHDAAESHWWRSALGSRNDCCHCNALGDEPVLDQQRYPRGIDGHEHGLDSGCPVIAHAPVDGVESRAGAKLRMVNLLADSPRWPWQPESDHRHPRCRFRCRGMGCPNAHGQGPTTPSQEQNRVDLNREANCVQIFSTPSALLSGFRLGVPGFSCEIQVRSVFGRSRRAVPDKLPPNGTKPRRLRAASVTGFAQRLSSPFARLATAIAARCSGCTSGAWAWTASKHGCALWQTARAPCGRG